jgi:hypothetical protein
MEVVMLRLIVVVVVVALMTVPASSQELKPTVEVRLEYLMTLEVPMDIPQLVGARRVVNVPAGGTLRGPKINGTVVAPSGDWLYNMPDGSSRLDVRLMVKTDDNELIFMEYGGVMAFPKEAADRLNKGEAVTSADGYFMTAPRFTTASTKYAWLNHVQAVGKMVSLQRGHAIKYDIFEMK